MLNKGNTSLFLPQYLKLIRDDLIRFERGDYNVIRGYELWYAHID